MKCFVVGAMVVVSLAASPSAAAAQSPASAETPASPPAAPAHQRLTFQGDVALWTVAIRPDKTAGFEQIMGRVRDALAKSSDPVRQRQAAGWKVMRIEKPLPNGNIAYVHVISPVVHDADYTVMQILYDAFPDERQVLYEMYRDAFAASVSLAAGPLAVDMSRSALPAVASR